MFACSLYPRDRAFLDTVRHEVRDVVRRLAPHPSIVLWSGNNENQGEGTSSVQRQLDYVLLYDTTVQEELRRHDRSRSYWPASPSNGVLIDDPDLGVFIQRWGSEGVSAGRRDHAGLALRRHPSLRLLLRLHGGRAGGRPA